MRRSVATVSMSVFGADGRIPSPRVGHRQTPDRRRRSVSRRTGMASRRDGRVIGPLSKTRFFVEDVSLRGRRDPTSSDETEDDNPELVGERDAPFTETQFFPAPAFEAVLEGRPLTVETLGGGGSRASRRCSPPVDSGRRPRPSRSPSACSSTPSSSASSRTRQLSTGRYTCSRSVGPARHRRGVEACGIDREDRIERTGPLASRGLELTRRGPRKRRPARRRR